MPGQIFEEQMEANTPGSKETGEGLLHWSWRKHHGLWPKLQRRRRKAARRWRWADRASTVGRLEGRCSFPYSFN